MKKFITLLIIRRCDGVGSERDDPEDERRHAKRRAGQGFRHRRRQCRRPGRCRRQRHQHADQHPAREKLRFSFERTIPKGGLRPSFFVSKALHRILDYSNARTLDNANDNAELGELGELGGEKILNWAKLLWFLRKVSKFAVYNAGKRCCAGDMKC